MANVFVMPDVTITGVGALAQSKVELKKLGQKALVVTGKHVVKSTMMEKLLETLKDLSIEAIVYDEILSEPTDTMILNGVEVYLKNKCDFCIGIGGGSPLDSAKAIVAMTVLEGKISDYMGKDVSVAMPPVVAIPTTAGTGSEATQFTIITDTEKDVKMLLKGRSFIPKLAIIDPEFTLTCPQSVTVATGLDALTHAVEAYTSKKATPMTDTFALSAIKKIFKFLPLVYTKPDDLDAREGLAIAALEAGICINNASVTLVHGISRPIGAVYHVPHGIANAMLLSICLKFAKEGAVSKFAILGRLIGVASDEDTDDLASDKFVTAVEELCTVLKVPNIASYGVEEADFFKNIDKMSDDALASGSPSNTLKVVEKSDVLKIYKDLWQATLV